MSARGSWRRVLALTASATSGVSLFDPNRRIFWLICASVVIVLGGVSVPCVEYLFRFATPSGEALLLAIAVAIVSGGWAGPWRWMVQRAQAVRGPGKTLRAVVVG